MLFVVVVALLQLLQDCSSQSIIAYTNRSIISSGASFDLNLQNYDIPKGAVFLDLICGHLNGLDIKPLVYLDISTNKLKPYPYIAQDSPEYKGRVFIPSDHVMRIIDIDFNDQGRTFQCVLHYKSSVTRSASSQVIKLHVVDFFGISINATDTLYRVEDQSSLTVHCNASGVPQPDVSWHHDGNIVSYQHTGSKWNTTLEDQWLSLVIPTVNLTHNGTYKCHGHNIAGYDYRNFTLVVYSKPGNITLDSACQFENSTVKICWSSLNDNPASPTDEYTIKLSDGIEEKATKSGCLLMGPSLNSTMVTITATNSYGSHKFTGNVTLCADTIKDTENGTSKTTIGIIIGVLALILLIALIIGCVIYMKKKNRKVAPSTPQQQQQQQNGSIMPSQQQQQQPTHTEDLP